MNIRTRLTVAMLSAVIVPLAIIAVMVVMKFRDSALLEFENRSSAEIRESRVKVGVKIKLVSAYNSAQRA